LRVSIRRPTLPSALPTTFHAQTVTRGQGEEMQPYLILGACNPPLAHRALTGDATLSLIAAEAAQRLDAALASVADPD
jgi:hypothetical protein